MSGKEKTPNQINSSSIPEEDPPYSQKPVEDDEVSLSDTPESNASIDSLGIKDELEKAQHLIDKYFNQLMYLQAEMENLQKQSKREIVEKTKNANYFMVKTLLTIVDELSIAITNIPDSVHQNGLIMVYDHFMKILFDHGLTPICPVGKPFDPYYHECVLKIPSEEPEDTVLEELQKGYLFHNTVLRHSQVKISGGPENE